MTVRINNPTYKRVAHNVATRQLTKFHVFNTLENLANHPQPTASATRQVDLSDVTGHHDR